MIEPHRRGRAERGGALLWAVVLSPWLRGLLYAGITAAFVLVVAGATTPSPLAVTGGPPEPRGVQRITRHPVFMGIGLWALLHLVPNGYASDVAFFGGFVLFALLGSWHQDRRKLATAAEAFRSFHAGTAFLPFTAAAPPCAGSASCGRQPSWAVSWWPSSCAYSTTACSAERPHAPFPRPVPRGRADAFCAQVHSSIRRYPCRC